MSGEGELKKRIREGGFKVEFDDDESWLPFVEKVLDEARADFPKVHWDKTRQTTYEWKVEALRKRWFGEGGGAEK